MNSFYKLMGIRLRIPQEFQNNEDLFMKQLMDALRSPFTSKKIVFFTPQKNYLQLHYSDIFTGAWDFTDEPNESHYNSAIDDYNSR